MFHSLNNGTGNSSDAAHAWQLSCQACYLILPRAVILILDLDKCQSSLIHVCVYIYVEPDFYTHTAIFI